MKAPSLDNTEDVLDFKKGEAFKCLTMITHRLWGPYISNDADDT